MKRANIEGSCPRCPVPISRGDFIVFRHGVWIHASCAPGADDE